MKHFLKQPFKQFLHSSLFFTDRIQIFFAILLVGIVFTIVFIATSQSHVPESSGITPSPSQQEPTAPEQHVAITIESNKAISIVNNLKEIQAAASTAASDNTKFVTEVDSYPTSQKDFYFIHAYEVISDGNGNAHTATVGWYKVNPQTGAVTKSVGN